MPLSKLQTDILRVLASQRDPESYVAGGAALNRSGGRYSQDIEIFHDREELVASAARTDCKILRTGLRRHDSKGLSAASLTPLFPPGFEIGQNRLLRQSALLDLAAHLGTQDREKLFFEIDRRSRLGPRKEDVGQPPATCHHDRRFRPEKTRRIVSKFSNSADLHVVTPVTIIVAPVLVPIAQPASVCTQRRGPGRIRRLLYERCRTLIFDYDEIVNWVEHDGRRNRLFHQAS
jgi:hypothetical protein